MCRNALRISSDDSDAYPLLAKMLLDEKDYQTAIDLIDEARTKIPDHSVQHEMLDPLYEEAIAGVKL